MTTPETTTDSEDRPGRVRRRVGTIERATRARIRALGKLDDDQSVHAAMALQMATAIDSFSLSITTAAQLSALTKAHADLRATMKILREGGADDGGGGADAGTGLPPPGYGG